MNRLTRGTGHTAMVILYPITLLLSDFAKTDEKADLAKPLTAQEEKEKALKIKSVASLTDGTLLLGGKGGLALWKNGVVEPQSDFPKVEVKVIVPDELGRWWVATEQEVYVKKPGATWEKVYPGEVRGISAAKDGSVYLSVGGGVGVKRSKDAGKTWETVIALLPESMLPPTKPAKERPDATEKPKG